MSYARYLLLGLVLAFVYTAVPAVFWKSFVYGIGFASSYLLGRAEERYWTKP